VGRESQRSDPFKEPLQFTTIVFNDYTGRVRRIGRSNAAASQKKKKKKKKKSRPPQMGQHARGL
jgi:hypothetical protein